MNYLGLDYGQKHLGVALATTPLSEPLTTLDTEKSLTKLPDLIKKYGIEAIIIGDCPQDFEDKLLGLGLPVYKEDETLSSYDARQALSHTTQTRRKEGEHAAAAAIILQAWLDSHP